MSMTNTTRTTTIMTILSMVLLFVSIGFVPNVVVPVLGFQVEEERVVNDLQRHHHYSQQLHSQQLHSQQQLKFDSRQLAVYALYNLHPFAVTFTTDATDELVTAYSIAINNNENENGATSTTSSTTTTSTLVSSTGQEDSSLSYPLREVTQQFLQQEFQNAILQWTYDLFGGSDGTNSSGSSNSNSTNSTSTSTQPPPPPNKVVPPIVESLDSSDIPYHEMYNNLVTVDLRVQLFVRNDIDGPLMVNGRRRVQRMGVRRQLQQQQSPSSQQQQQQRAHVVAEIYPTIAFVEPSDTTSKPSNTQIQTLFGDILLGELFTTSPTQEKYEIQLKTQSLQPMLQQLTDLNIVLNIHAVGSPAGTTTTTMTTTSDGDGGWSSTIQSVVLSLLIVLSIIAVGVALLFVRQRHITKRRLQFQQQQLALDSRSLSRDEYHDEFVPPTTTTSGGGTTSNSRHTNNNGGGGSRGHHVFYDDSSFASSVMSSLSGTFTGFNFGTPSSVSSLSRPMSIGNNGQQQQQQRSVSLGGLDAVRHGQDTFPAGRSSVSASASVHESNALHVLEASDRYLSRHRPDLYYDEHHRQTNGTVSVFGRTYEIPSNPFDYIYRRGSRVYGGPQQQEPQVSPLTGGNGGTPTFFGTSPGGAFFPPSTTATTGTTTTTTNRILTRSASFSGTTPSPRNPSSSFTPISPGSSVNIAAGATVDDEAAAAAAGGGGSGGYTGESLSHHTPSSSSAAAVSYQGSFGSSIWRNLSMSSWYGGGGTNYNHEDVDDSAYMSTSHYHDNNEDLYDQDRVEDYSHSNPHSSEIELEDLPPGTNIRLGGGDYHDNEYHDDDDVDSYDFAFQDFPRHDGTPCLIYNEDALLKEREAKQRKIFVIDDNVDNADDNADKQQDSSFDEKKSMDEDELTKPVSDQAFMNMLSQNSLAIDGEALSRSYDDVGDISMDSNATPPATNDTPQYGKSNEFRQQLAQLMETKQRRYAMEYKKEEIVNQHRKNRKQVREQERRNRHKAMEQEIEDIEAEFFSPMDGNRRTTNLTMSPMRKDYPAGAGTASHSPVPSSSAARHGGMRAGSPQVMMVGGSSPNPYQRHRRSGSTASHKASSPVPSRHHRSSSSASLKASSPVPSRHHHHRRAGSNVSIGRRAPSPSAVHRHRRTNSFAPNVNTTTTSVASSPILRTGSLVHPTSSGDRGRRSDNNNRSNDGDGGGVFRPRTSYGGDTSRVTASSSMGDPRLFSTSNLNPDDFDVSQEFKLKVRPVDLYGSDRFNDSTTTNDETTLLNDLSMPTMGDPSPSSATNTTEKESAKSKYPSPQSVIDEIMNGGTSSSSSSNDRHPPKSSHNQPHRHHTIHRPSAASHHRRTRTPTKTPSFQNSLSSTSSFQHRRVNSFDVPDAALYHRGGSPSLSSRSSTRTIDGHNQPSYRQHHQQSNFQQLYQQQQLHLKNPRHSGQRSIGSGVTSPSPSTSSSSIHRRTASFGGDGGGVSTGGRRRSSSVSSSNSVRSRSRSINRRSNNNTSHKKHTSNNNQQQHRRSSSQHSEDLFLHGVVAQTRFI